MTTNGALAVHPSNNDQLRGWNGDQGTYWAAHADHFERALAAYHGRYFATAAIGVDDRVLDVGCGTGGTSRVAARTASAGSVVGVDLSSAMLDVARERAAAEGLINVRFEQADAQICAFEPAAFDIALGQTSAMFFGDRVAGLKNVGRALRSGGRITLLTWQPLAANEWIRELSTALSAGRDLPAPRAEAPGPFTLADPETIRSVLTDAGYRDVALDAESAPMWFGHNAEDAYGLVFGLFGWMLEGLDETDRTRALDRLLATIDAHATADGVEYGSAVWIIRAARP